jgi:hypothetical protein
VVSICASGFYLLASGKEVSGFTAISIGAATVIAAFYNSNKSKH